MIEAEHQDWRMGRGGLVALLALAAIQGVVWVGGLPADGDATTSFAWRGTALALPYAAAAAIAWRRRDRFTVALVLIAAVVFRLAAVTWPPELSSDLYRYVWDGRVQLAGESPYAASPADPALTHLRDEHVWPRINRPEAVTVYPPGAQVAFLALAKLGGRSVDAVKIAALCAELVALALMALALRRRRMAAGQLILYAWSPLLIAEVCVSGHVDALVLPLAIGALMVCKRRPGWSGALIGVATLLKLYPVLLLAAIPRDGRIKAVATAAGVVLLGYVPYALAAGSGVLGFLPDYVRTGEDFNPALRGFLQSGLAPLSDAARHIAVVATALALAVTCTVIAVWDDADPTRAARRIAVAFVLLLPTAIHPWYAMWLVPLLSLSFSGAALWIVCALPLSYLKYGTAADVMPAWVPAVEWLPAVALIALAMRHWLRARVATVGAT